MAPKKANKKHKKNRGIVLATNVEKLLKGVPSFEYRVKGGSAVEDVDGRIYRIMDQVFVLEAYEAGKVTSTEAHKRRERISRALQPFRGGDNPMLENYYTSSGAKVTKPLRSLILKEVEVPKEEVTLKWGKVCKAVSELYLPDFTVIGSLSLPKGYFGEGIIERGPTCFAIDGENAHHKIMLMHHNRVRLFFLQRADNPKARARCIAHFTGDRRVHLYNFYYAHFPENYRIFVDAFRYRFGLNGEKDIAWGRGSSTLPVYYNGDAIYMKCLKNGDEEPYRKARRFHPCPACGYKVRASSETLCEGCYDNGIEPEDVTIHCAGCDREYRPRNLYLSSGDEVNTYICNRCMGRDHKPCACCSKSVNTAESFNSIRVDDYPVPFCNHCYINCSNLESKARNYIN